MSRSRFRRAACVLASSSQMAGCLRAQARLRLARKHPMAKKSSDEGVYKIVEVVGVSEVLCYGTAVRVVEEKGG